MNLLTKRLLTVVVTALLLVLSTVPAQASTQDLQRRLNELGCDAGPVDGVTGAWTRSAVVRFQSRHGFGQTGTLTAAQRTRLFQTTRRCDRRPVPSYSGRGRRIVISQRQNWVWLVRADGRVVAQGGIIDNTGELSRGRYYTKSYCGRPARIRWNTSNGSRRLYLQNFVRFAPCGIGFHRIPTTTVNGAQIHPDWYLGTDFKTSGGCIRVSKAVSFAIWDYTGAYAAPVHVVRG